GVGFTSCCVTFLLFTLVSFHGSLIWIEGIKAFLWSFYILPFTLFYYSYATLLQNKEKEISRITLYLTAITGISFAVLIIFEIIEFGIPFAGFFPILFGLYLAYCLIHKEGILNLRGFAWLSFILSWIMFLYCVITLPF
ncbi:MAG: hypothetical protein FWE78_03150, partial [Methanimicrococcus sp.]|nr:hypothetical protein [Methanimicrococcus sp.]